MENIKSKFRVHLLEQCEKESTVDTDFIENYLNLLDEKGMEYMLKYNYDIYQIDDIIHVVDLIKRIDTGLAIGIIEKISEKSNIEIMDIETVEELFELV